MWCDGIGWDRMWCGGMGWDGVRWDDDMGWDMVGWSGVEWSGVGWSGVRGLMMFIQTTHEVRSICLSVRPSTCTLLANLSNHIFVHSSEFFSVLLSSEMSPSLFPFSLTSI